MKQDLLKATVISMFPLEINEMKPGLYPGYYHIDAAPHGDFRFLVVGDAVYYTENKNDQVQTVKTPFHTLADSIVHDFMENHIGRIVGDDETAAEPAVFWVPGGYEIKNGMPKEYYEQAAHEYKAYLVKTYTNEIAIAEQKQLRWFEQLIMIADDVYNRTRRHTSVSKLQRLAAQRLNLQRPWMIDVTGADHCPFCKSSLPYEAVVCPNCRNVINRAAYEKLLESNNTTVQ
jgi:hypothetical protein